MKKLFLASLLAVTILSLGVAAQADNDLKAYFTSSGQFYANNYTYWTVDLSKLSVPTGETINSVTLTFANTLNKNVGFLAKAPAGIMSVWSTNQNGVNNNTSVGYSPSISSSYTALTQDPNNAKVYKVASSDLKSFISDFNSKTLAIEYTPTSNYRDTLDKIATLDIYTTSNRSTSNTPEPSSMLGTFALLSPLGYGLLRKKKK